MTEAFAADHEPAEIGDEALTGVAIAPAIGARSTVSPEQHVDRICRLLVESASGKASVQKLSRALDLLASTASHVDLQALKPDAADRVIMALFSAIPVAVHALQHRLSEHQVRALMQCAAGLVSLWGVHRAAPVGYRSVVEDWFDHTVILARELEIAALQVGIRLRGDVWMQGERVRASWDRSDPTTSLQ